MDVELIRETKYNLQRKRPPIITQDRVKELFEYNEESGQLIRKITMGNSKAGTVMRTLSSYGYIRVMIDGHRYHAHQVVWMYVYGEWPSRQIDHIDNNKTNNAISNLRMCDSSTNCLNQRSARKNNKLNVHGVHQLPSGNFRAQCQVNGRKINLGVHQTQESAFAAYKAFKESIHAS